MSQIVELLQTSNPEYQMLYNQIQEFWRINILDIFDLMPDKRKVFANSLKEKFNTDFSSEQKHIISTDLSRMAKELLGCKIVVWGIPLEISMIEIYADGIFDEAGDLIKGLYGTQMNKLSGNLTRERDSIEIIRDLPKDDYKFLNKLLKGPRIYFFSGRLDIVILDKYLPFSFLIRQLRNEEGNLVDILGSEDNIHESIAGLKTIKIETISDFGSSWAICNSLNEKEIGKLLQLSRTGGILMQSSNNEIYLLDKTTTVQDSDCKLRIESSKHTGLGGDFTSYPWNLRLKSCI